jgi:hypothetical protein
MATIKKSICTLGIFIVIFTFNPFIVTAQAEQPIDCLLCCNMTTTPIVQSEDLNIMCQMSEHRLPRCVRT